MPRLTRYVLFELTKVFLIVLIGMTLLLLLVGVVREAVSQSLGLAQIARLLPFTLPDALRFSLPGSALFAACSVYGRMSSSNEVVAIKSAGISPLRILWPALVASFVLSLATVWLNDLAVSWGRSGVQRVVIEAAEEIVYAVLRTHRSYSNKQLSITVKRVEGRKLSRPTLTLQPTGDRPLVTITAAEAELRSNTARDMLVIEFRNASVDFGDNVRSDFPGALEWEIPLADAASGKRESSSSPSYRPLRSIPDDLDEQRQRIGKMEQQLAVKAAFACMTGDWAAVAGPAWTADTRKLNDQRSRLYRLQVEPHRRWAAGFSCFCFVIIGAPLAIRLRNDDFLKTFFICFLPILIGYYPLLAYGVDRTKAGAIPPQFVWLGNVILLICGVWLTRRAIRY
jgi:lipopolysaccharide export system permease protein